MPDPAPTVNVLKEKLADGSVARGVWGMLPSPEAYRLLSRVSGLDWVVVDMEHGPIDATVMNRMVATMLDAGGPLPIVRVPVATTSYIKQALDAGALGIVCPMVNSQEQAQRVVADCNLPPVGVRSFGSPWSPLALNVAADEYIKRINREILVIVQIESKEALQNLDGILSVPGIDVAFVGPFDLSISLGVDQPGPGSQDKKLVDALAAVLEASRRHGVASGVYCADGQGAHARIQQGFKFVNVANDVLGLISHVQQQLAASK